MNTRPDLDNEEANQLLTAVTIDIALLAVEGALNDIGVHDPSMIDIMRNAVLSQLTVRAKQRTLLAKYAELLEIRKIDEDGETE